MHKRISEENIHVKRGHKRFLDSSCVMARAYDADKGCFADNKLIEIVVSNNSNFMHCGVGEHY